MGLFTDTFVGSDNDEIASRTGWTATGGGPTSGVLINASNEAKEVGATGIGIRHVHLHADH